MNALCLLAPAKLNLVLKVVGRRADGYHLLETLFHAIDLCDELHAARAPGAPEALTLSAADARAALPEEPDNLVLRAARLFAARARVAPGFRFHLHKRIPPGSGLGGGSSDAAAALRLCNALCGEPLAADALQELARELGADVAFFLRGGSQWGRGIGDELLPAAGVPDRHFLLLVPPFGCATAEVYRNYAAHWNEASAAATIDSARDRHHKDSAVRDRFENDLEAAAVRVRPELQTLRARVRELGVPSLHMTGSGSAWFVPCADAAAVADLAARLSPLQDPNGEGVRLYAVASAAGHYQPELSPWPGGGG